jgi:hypothetical protein
MNYVPGKRAIPMLEAVSAIQLCPLTANSPGGTTNFHPSPSPEVQADHRSLAEAALERQRLQPDSGVVHLALAGTLNTTHNIEEADTQIQLAERTRLTTRARNCRRSRVADRWDEAPGIERAISLEPRDPAAQPVG